MYFYHCDYTRLNDFLTKDYAPQEIGDKLDTVMGRLVAHVYLDGSYHEYIAGEHYLLTELRDIFWALQPMRP